MIIEEFLMKERLNPQWPFVGKIHFQHPHARYKLFVKVGICCPAVFECEFSQLPSLNNSLSFYNTLYFEYQQVGCLYASVQALFRCINLIFLDIFWLILYLDVVPLLILFI